MKTNFDHWWEFSSYRKQAARAAADPRTANAWKMEEAVAFVYELVRRLPLTDAEISPKEKTQISELYQARQRTS